MYREKIILKVTNNINKFIDRCIKRKIELLNISYIDKDNVLIKIYVDDLEVIEKINYYSKIKVYKKMGLSRLLLCISSGPMNIKYALSC